jgi:putative ABC transport system substrate-binding protein
LGACRAAEIIFAYVTDPVRSGFVASFPWPGGNVTGFNVSETTLAGKWVELRKEIAPHVARVDAVQPDNSALCRMLAEPLQSRRCLLRSRAIAAPVHDTSELVSVVAALASRDAGCRCDRASR